MTLNQSLSQLSMGTKLELHMFWKKISHKSASSIKVCILYSKGSLLGKFNQKLTIKDQ